MTPHEEAVARAARAMAATEEQLATIAWALTAPDRVDTIHWVGGRQIAPRGDRWVVYPAALACRLDVARARHEVSVP